MNLLTPKRLMVFFVSLSLILAIGVNSSIADQKKTKISGKITATTLHAAGVGIDDVEGHRMTVEEYEGINVNTSEHQFMDGAEFIAVGTGDHINGTGTGHGYAKFALSDDQVFFKHEGKVKTNPPSNGRRNTTFEGTILFIKGTGKYQNIPGTGTYKGR